jgi:hypothetical protein
MARGFRKCETCGSHGHGGRGCPVYRLNQQQERRRAQRGRDLSFGLTPELEREIILIRKAWKIAAAMGSLLLCATSLFAGTVTGRLQTATGGAVTNGTLSFRLSQPAVIVGTASVVTSPASCYISAAGNIVGVPDPLVAPILSANTVSGSLPAGTYFVVVTYAGASGESVASPESTVVLSAQGTLIVSAPVKQPANATGYNVYIGTSSGAETLQASVTGFTQYSQTSALGSGAASPGSNSSVCSLAFSDQLIPSGTYYSVNLVNKNGSTIAGFPQTWCTYGGQAGVINVSNGAPTGNCGTNGVFYPTPIFAAPQNNAPQSISSALSLGTNAFAAGPITASSLDNILFVDGAKYGNIAAAVAGAGLSSNALIVIPSSYSGTECPATALLNVTFWDLRGGNNVCSQNILSYNTTSGSGLVSFVRGIHTTSSVTSAGNVSGYFQNILNNATCVGTCTVDGGSFELDIQGTFTGAMASSNGAEDAISVTSTGGAIAELDGELGYLNSGLGSTTAITTVVGVHGIGCHNILGTAPVNCYGFFGDQQFAGSARNYAGGFSGPALALFGSNASYAGLDAEDASHVAHQWLLIDASNNTVMKAVNAAGIQLQSSAGTPQQKITSTGTVFSTGVGGDGSGFKHKRFGATTATAASANAVASTTYSWTTGFTDTSYTPICSPEGTVTGTPVYQGVISFNTSGVTVQVMAATAAASSFGGIYCHAVHD